MLGPTQLYAVLAHRPILRQMIRPVVAFVSIVGVAVVGFTILADVGIVDGLFWLIDPGGIDGHFRNHAGPETTVKAYALVVYAGLIVVGLWMVETIFSTAFGGQIRQEFRHMQIERRIDELDGHVIVCGYGTFGKTIARRLQNEGRPVVVIERNGEQLERAIDDGLLAVGGDARYERTLEEAGVRRAATVVGAIDDATANIQIAVTATKIAESLELIVRAGNRMDRTLARTVGADQVIIPEVVCGERVCETLELE